MYVICSEVRFVEISPPNECDKILKIPNEQTEPTDYMANCEVAFFYEILNVLIIPSNILLIAVTSRPSPAKNNYMKRAAGMEF